MKIYRIWISSKSDDFEDYEARTATEAINMYRKETGYYYFWDMRIILIKKEMKA